MTDEYSFFYPRFIEDHQAEHEGIWVNLSQKQAYKIWSGYAFESLCMKHISQLKQALDISGIYTRSAANYQKVDNHQSGRD